VRHVCRKSLNLQYGRLAGVFDESKTKSHTPVPLMTEFRSALLQVCGGYHDKSTELLAGYERTDEAKEKRTGSEQE
jgi:hypothetical protein